MAPDKLAPSDPRATHHTATVRGKKYHYIVSKPNGKHTGTVLLVHGFPDLGFGWRYQVPFITSLGYQVIVPDMLGFGQTDAPDDLHAFGFKSMAADMAELVAQVAPGESIILGGHDWGGAFVWRMALWQPDLVAAVFSVCTPYSAPLPVYVDLPMVAERMPNFAYQLQFSGPDIVREIQGKDKVRQFLNVLYGGRGPNGEFLFDPTKGVSLEKLDTVGPTPLLSKEEMDYYVDEYSRNGLKGPTNWYRLRQVNFEDERELLKDGLPKIRVPSLMLSADSDSVLLPELTNGMEKHFDHLEKRIVKGTHWTMWYHSDEVNNHIGEFLNGLSKSAGPKAAI